LSFLDTLPSGRVLTGEHCRRNSWADHLQRNQTTSRVFNANSHTVFPKSFESDKYITPGSVLKLAGVPENPRAQDLTFGPGRNDVASRYSFDKCAARRRHGGSSQTDEMKRVVCRPLRAKDPGARTSERERVLLTCKEAYAVSVPKLVYPAQTRVTEAAGVQRGVGGG